MAKSKTKPAKDYGYLFEDYQTLVSSNTPSLPTTQRTSISDEIAREKKLKNDDTEQDIELKKKTLDQLFKLLVAETAVVFVFAFLQATHLWGFSLEEWSFKLLTTVTITQITVMLFVAVNYLFPKKNS